MAATLFTHDGRRVEVENIWVISARQDAEGQWIQMGGKVALMPNGAYCHGDGDLLPFESEEEIRQIFMTRAHDGGAMVIPEMQRLLDAMLEWFSHRADFDSDVVQKVVLNREGYPELEDGTPATEEQVYAWYKPGAALSAAIVGLYKRTEADQEAARAAKPEIYQQAPAPPPGQPKVAGDLVAKPEKHGKPLTKAQLAKRRATKAANKGKATKAMPASQAGVAAAG